MSGGRGRGRMSRGRRSRKPGWHQHDAIENGHSTQVKNSWIAHRLEQVWMELEQHLSKLGSQGLDGRDHLDMPMR